MTTALHVEEPSDIDQARLDDDGGTRQRSSGETHLRMRDARIETPMIPGAREPGMLSTFGVPTIVFGGSPITMDAATIAAHQRDGGGGANQRRQAPAGSWSQRLGKRVLWVLFGLD